MRLLRRELQQAVTAVADEALDIGGHAMLRAAELTDDSLHRDRRAVLEMDDSMAVFAVEVVRRRGMEMILRVAEGTEESDLLQLTCLDAALQ